MKHYTQCLLDRNGSRQHAWIPKEFATPGKFIKIKENGIWTDGWQVISSFDSMEEKAVKKQSNYYKNTRDGSDI